MAYRTRWARLFSGVALAATAALAAVGCTSGSATSASGSASGKGRASVPTVTVAEANQAFGVWRASIVSGAYFNDKQSLAYTTDAARASYRALQRVWAFYHQRASGGGARLSAPVFYLPEPAGYPRWFVADVSVTSPVPSPPARFPASALVPSISTGRYLLLFEQESASDRWRLASSSQLLHGMPLPALAKDADGRVPVVPLSDTALVARPDLTGPLQAAVVDDGPASPATRVVASGSATTALYDSLKTSLLGQAVPRGDVAQWELEGSNFPQFALRTADGGALVLYAMYLNTIVQTPASLAQSRPLPPGPLIAVSPYLKALLPSGQRSPRVKLESQVLVSSAAVDPPAGHGMIQVVALTGVQDYASAS